MIANHNQQEVPTMNPNVEKIKELLMGDGVSIEFVMERLGLRKKAALKVMRDFGAFCDYNARKWRLHNVERVKKCYRFRYNFNMPTNKNQGDSV